MEIKDLDKIMPLKPTALSITIHNQAKALKSMASVVDRLEHQLNNMKRITIQKQEKLEEQEYELVQLREDNEHMSSRIEILEKENEDLRKNVTKN